MCNFHLNRNISSDLTKNSFLVFYYFSCVNFFIARPFSNQMAAEFFKNSPHKTRQLRLLKNKLLAILINFIFSYFSLMTKFWTLDVALEALPFIWPNDLVFKSMVRFIYTFPSLVSRFKFRFSKLDSRW